MKKGIVRIICYLFLGLFLFVGCSNKSNGEDKVKDNSKEQVSNNGNDTNANKNIPEVSKDKNDKTVQAQQDKNNIAKKQEYLNRMNSLSEDLDVKYKVKFAGTTHDMLEASSEIYKAWDEILNEVYVDIIGTLSKEEKDKLVSEEVAWIKERDKKSDNAAKEVTGGTLEPVIRAGSLGTSTKERCYELVNKYIK